MEFWTKHNLNLPPPNIMGFIKRMATGVTFVDLKKKKILCLFSSVEWELNWSFWGQNGLSCDFVLEPAPGLFKD